MVSAIQDASALMAASEALAAAVDEVARAVVVVLASRHGPSSGVLWRPGVVVTTAHTIRRDEGIRVILPDGERSDAVLAGVDASTDLAVLKLEAAGGQVAEVGDSASVRAGHFVFAVARDGSGQPAASFGIVAAAGGEWRTWRGGHIDRLIRLDGGLHPGFSGGPVADARGRVIGVGTPALARGFGIVLPPSTVNRVTDALLESGRVARGYLGIGTQPVALPASLGRKLGLQEHGGLIVLSLAPQGPAERGGMLVGDILLDLEGRPLREIRDLQAALGGERIGEQVRVGLVRGGERIESTITLGQRPQQGC
ncbi:MAG TPA: trypsin-like peptidase domain-containing protein [Burkholderiales bacterium]|nr:trypsin-like peptidase domain-containing protein [Burkholderiales bacterium]